MPDELRDLLLNEHVLRLYPESLCVIDEEGEPLRFETNNGSPVPAGASVNRIVYAVEDALMVNGFTLGCDQETPQSFDVYQGRGPVYVRESSRPLAALRAWARLSEGG